MPAIARRSITSRRRTPVATAASRHISDAESLGITDPAEVRQYVEQRLAEEEQERARNAQIQADEMEEARHARDERQREREHEMALAQLQHGSQANSGPTSSEEEFKLPPWTEGETAEAFFARFERFAKDFNWSEKSKFHRLLASLKGKRLAQFAELEGREEATYQDLKCSLLATFDTEAHLLGDDFFKSRIQKGETATSFASRLKAQLNKYIKKDGAEKTYEGLSDLIMRYVFRQSCSSDLAKDFVVKKTKTMESMKEQAEAWFSVYGHPTAKLFNTSLTSANKTSASTNKAVQGATAKTSNTQEAKKGYKCNICKSNDHIWIRCPKRKQKSSSKKETSQSSAKKTE